MLSFSMSRYHESRSELRSAFSHYVAHIWCIVLMAQRTKQNFPLTVPLFQSNPQITSIRHQKEWRCPICGAIFDQEQTKDIHMASCKRNSHPQQFHNYPVVDNPISELFMYFYLNNSIYLEHFISGVTTCHSVFTHTTVLWRTLLHQWHGRDLPSGLESL